MVKRTNEKLRKERDSIRGQNSTSLTPLKNNVENISGKLVPLLHKAPTTSQDNSFTSRKNLSTSEAEKSEKIPSEPKKMPKLSPLMKLTTSLTVATTAKSYADEVLKNVSSYLNKARVWIK